MRNRVSFCYITIYQNPMGLSKHYETLKFLLLRHPWAFKNLRVRALAFASPVINSHCLKIPGFISHRGQNMSWGGEAVKNRGCLMMKSSVKHSDRINSSCTTLAYSITCSNISLPKIHGLLSDNHHLYNIYLGKAKKAKKVLADRRGEKKSIAHLYPLLPSFLTNGVVKTSTYSQPQFWEEDDKCWGRRKKPHIIKSDREHMERKKKPKPKNPNQHNTTTADTVVLYITILEWYSFLSCTCRILLLYYWPLVLKSL